LRLHADLVTHRLGGFLQLLRRHVGVRDPGRTSGDGDNLHRGLLGCETLAYAAAWPSAPGVFDIFFNTLFASAVTTTPTIIATMYIRRLSTTGSTIGPPCGAWSPTPASMATTLADIEPSMMHGITRNGSAAANGIAPSVIPIMPIP